MMDRAGSRPWALFLALGLALGAALILPPSPPARAQTPQDAGEEMRQRLGAALEERERITQALDQAQADLERLEKDTLAGEAQARDLAEQQKTLAGRLPEVSEQLDYLAPRVERLKTRFHRHLRALYLFGPDASIALLASSQDFHDALTRAQAMTRLLDSERRVYHELTAQRARLAELRAMLALRQNQVQELQGQLDEQQARLAELRQARLELTRELQERQASLEENVAALKEAEARLARTFALAEPGQGAPTGVTRARGRLSPPVEGQLVGRWGPAQRGVLLQAREGAPVRSPWAGAVVHAGTMAGYGQVVVLDHGERVHTVLAHLGALSVEKGQEIKAGQAVGALDSEGVLYLEVRRGTKAENPLDWLRLGP